MRGWIVCPVASASAAGWRACWCQQADALLVDEPLSALDPRLARQTLAVVQDWKRLAARPRWFAACTKSSWRWSHFPRIVGLCVMGESSLICRARNEVTDNDARRAVPEHANADPTSRIQ
jgi:hypothetical protein